MRTEPTALVDAARDFNSAGRRLRYNGKDGVRWQTKPAVGNRSSSSELRAMGLPRPKEARLYYRAAKQRSDDAALLLQAGRTTGAVYLAGYTVECSLKALILAGAAPRLRKELLHEFRGSRAHNLEWLGALYRRHVAAVPRPVIRHLTRLASWSTDLRYAAGALKRSDADEFMESVVAIAVWADGRM